jgi:hypothetical protein
MTSLALILGCLVLVLIAGGGALLRRIYLKRQAARRLASIPSRITVNPTAHPNWENAAEEERLTAELRDLQFYEVGTFAIPELSMLLKGFLRPEDRVTAAFFEHRDAGIWLDLYIEYENGNSLTVSNSPHGGDLDEIPGHGKIVDRNLNLVQMIQLLDERRGPGTVRYITPIELPELVRKAYARDHDWHMSREEPKMSVLLRMADQVEPAPVLPCESGPCPYEYGRDSDRQIEGMPFPTRPEDRRTCPIYGHLCPEFMEELGLTVEDLRIRATIHCGFEADDLVKKGKLGKDSREYRELRSRCQETMAEYPAEQFPQYYR